MFNHQNKERFKENTDGFNCRLLPKLFKLFPGYNNYDLLILDKFVCFVLNLYCKDIGNK